jgi:hypothetical protein
MSKKDVVMCLTSFLIFIGISSCTSRTNRVGSEKLIAQIDFSSWIPESYTVSPDNKRLTFVASVGNKWTEGSLWSSGR